MQNGDTHPHIVHHYWRHNMLWLVAGVILSCFTAVVVHATIRWTRAEPAAIHVDDGEAFSFTNPLIECEAYNRLWFDELNPFKDKIESFAKAALRDGKVSSLSVYFRDMNNGYWFGINEKALFCPASLMKVPLLIAYLKAADLDHHLLHREYKYDKELATFIQGTDPTPLVKGQTYAVVELLEIMIRKSDNEATLLLYENIDKDFLLMVQDDLGFTYSVDATMDDDILSVKKYSSFFRVLYNASYVSRRHSELGLAILSKAEFPSGLRQGVKATVPISHKFAMRRVAKNGEPSAQFHHAGIVYHSMKPYLLCVMTRGKDGESLNWAVSQISSIIYREVDTQTKRTVGKSLRLAMDVDEDEDED